MMYYDVQTCDSDLMSLMVLTVDQHFTVAFAFAVWDCFIHYKPFLQKDGKTDVQAFLAGISSGIIAALLNTMDKSA